MRTITAGLDAGTQGAKLCLLEVDGRVARIRALVRESYGLLPPREPGEARQDPASWEEATVRLFQTAFREAGLGPAEIGAIGVSAQQHGLVCAGEDGRALAPAPLWCDTTAAREARELTQRLGRRIPAGFTAPKLLRLLRREPELYARTRWVLLPHDWLNLRLTDRAAMEPGDASGTGFFDPDRGRFDEAALAAIDSGLADRLPQVVEPGTVLGRVSATGAARFGLVAGTPVATGGGDNMMSAVGAGATRPGVTVLSLGTSATLFAHSSRPVRDPEELIAPFASSTGGHLPLICIMNATQVLGEACAAFAPLGRTELEDLAGAADAECGGMLFLPYIAGERVPDLPRASGALLGLRPGLLRPALVYRAALEGVSAAIALGAERLRRQGVAVDEVRVVGGGSASSVWLRILADALEAPVQVLPHAEAAALGAALHAHWTLRKASEPDLDADTALHHLVDRSGPRVEPDPAGRAAQARVRRRLEAATRHVFTGPLGAAPWD
jgi:xylulokinase